MLAGSLDVAVAEVTAAEQEPQLSVERMGEHGGVFYCRAGHPCSRDQDGFEDSLGVPAGDEPAPRAASRLSSSAGAAGRFDAASGHFLPAITLDSVSLMKRAVRETDAVSWATEVLIASELREAARALPVSALLGPAKLRDHRSEDRR